MLAKKKEYAADKLLLSIEASVGYTYLSTIYPPFPIYGLLSHSINTILLLSLQKY